MGQRPEGHPTELALTPELHMTRREEACLASSAEADREAGVWAEVGESILPMRGSSGWVRWAGLGYVLCQTQSRGRKETA